MPRHWNSLVNKPKLLFFVNELTWRDCSQIVRSQRVKCETRDSNERSSDISARNCIQHLKRGIPGEILQTLLAKLLKLPSTIEVDVRRAEKSYGTSRKYLFWAICHCDYASKKKIFELDCFAATNFMISTLYSNSLFDFICNVINQTRDYKW